MNKKGFTLTELLAVIAIIAVVSLIGTVSITGIRAKIDENLFDSKLQLAIGAARNWGEDNKELLTNNCTINGSSVKCITKKISYFFGSYLEADIEKKDDGTEVKHFYNNQKVDIQNNNMKVYIKTGRVYACISTDTNIKTEIYNKYKC